MLTCASTAENKYYNAVHTHMVRNFVRKLQKKKQLYKLISVAVVYKRLQVKVLCSTSDRGKFEEF